MELKVSPEKPGFLSSDAASDTEEKDISEGEDEDNDRNHKHRRQDAQSHQGDSLHNHLTRPHRKRNRPYENGYFYREGDPQSAETWKNFNIASDRDLSSRFDRRRLNQGSFSKASPALNQRIRGNQILPGEVGPARGREREPISWGFHDSRFGVVDVASQIVQPGPVPSAMFAGRGLYSSACNAFGLVPGLPNGGLDSVHPLGLQGPLIPAINPPINIGLPRQQCRDFEECGFCLRGDMCPVEHGVNRIVIEDVQCLSQFNLPVSLPASQIPGTSSAQGALPLSSKNVHSKSSKPGRTENSFGLNGGVVGGSMAGASTSDVYDPDQPLWGNDNPETSAAEIVLNQSNADETESFLEVNLPNQQSIESVEGFNDDHALRNATTADSQSSSVWGRMGSSKSGLGAKGKVDLARTSSSYLEQDNKTEKTPNIDSSNVPNQGKRMIVHGNGSFSRESLVKKQRDFIRDIRNPAQKALCTLFVNYIPLNDNKREALLSHIQKFGEVIDIYIPGKTERAFVQFSKSEEAEAALQAPDAVLGNRFIKLWWANRENIPVDGISSTLPITPRPAVPNQFILNRGKENPHPATDKDSTNSHASVAEKAMFINGCKAPPVQQKKLESLEILKEELRKKQEMLDQKRRTNSKNNKDMPAAKMIKDETPPSLATDETFKSSPGDPIPTSHTSNSTPTSPAYEPLRPFHPLAPFVAKRFKLDNRPTAFRVVPPLPSGLGDVCAVEEHFSSYGDLASVVLEGSNDASVSALVSFTTRRSAEQAFLHGKSWRGHKLQFLWLSSSSGNLPPVSDTQQTGDNIKTADEPGTQKLDADPDSSGKQDKACSCTMR